MMGNWGQMAGWGWIFMVAFWALLVAGLVWLVRSVVATRPGAGGPDRARHILDGRFAAGEITPEDYRARRDVLERR